LPVTDMEKLMLDNTTVSDDELAALGNQRAQAVEQWLVANGKIPGERIFIIAAKTGAPVAQEGKDVSPGRVDFSLR
jgi:outer membrane protein OmpA-like peptidoglycan-associated protein